MLAKIRIYPPSLFWSRYAAVKSKLFHVPSSRALCCHHQVAFSRATDLGGLAAADFNCSALLRFPGAAQGCAWTSDSEARPPPLLMLLVQFPPSSGIIGHFWASACGIPILTAPTPLLQQTPHAVYPATWTYPPLN
jgi:hypothetical protein